MIQELRSPSNNYIDGELQRLVKDLEAQFVTGDFPTTDEQYGLINKMKEIFFQALRHTHTASIRFEGFEFLNPIKQRKLLKASTEDISAAYDRTEDSQQDFQNRANKFFSFKRSVEDRVATANGVLQSTAVFNDIGVFEIGDSFNDLSRIDKDVVTSEAPLDINNTVGVLTLPRKLATAINPATTVVLDSSNGFIPDGFTLDVLSDNNSDTWFEYHRIPIDQDDSVKLKLDLLIKLKLPTVINFIRISPLILTDKAFPTIESIETSLDGRIYTDIRDSIPGFITKEEENALFTLGPVGFRNQSNSDFVLTPRVTQFIKIKFRQSKKVLQTDLTYLQSIAIRDINIQQISYQDHGEIQTVALPLPFIPRKLLIEERIAQTEPLTSVAYQISNDGGTIFHPAETDTSIEINTGTANSVEIEDQTRDVRIKILATRDTENFNGIAAPLASTIQNVRESIPIGRPPIIFTLRGLPIQDTLNIYRPLALIGEVGNGTIIHPGGGHDNLNVEIPIPIKKFSERITVDGHEWDRVANFDMVDPDSTNYMVDYENGLIIFGDNTKGLVPEGEIRIHIDPEEVVIPDTTPYNIELDFNHDFNESHIDVKWVGPPKKVQQEILSRGTNIFELANTNISPSITVREEVPAGTTLFNLGYIPKNQDELIFSDQSVFASGEYTATKVVSGLLLSPINIRTNKSTSNIAPGFVEYEAIARIVNQRDTYNPETFNINELEVYTPTFNDLAIFSIEREFINGKNELLEAGDYSIDYVNGIVYSFSDTKTDGSTFINYFYSPQKDLEWSFTDSSKTLVVKDDSVLINRNDLNTIILVQDTTNYFLLFKDNRYIWVPYKQEYVSNPSVEVDTADLAEANRPLQEPDPRIDFTFVPANDFIRGQVLPEGKTRVNLPHDQLVKNSVRFIFVSDDINSFDDRIVTRDENDVIQVLPKPVKDVYGNSLTGSNIGTITQRDIDKQKINHEVQFINGRDELESGGDFSVDYEEGILYTYDPIPAYTIIQYEFSDIRVSYLANIQLVRDVDYSVNFRNLEVTINNVGTGLEVPNGTLLALYNIIENFAQDPAKIIEFYTPIIYGYRLKASRG